MTKWPNMSKIYMLQDQLPAGVMSRQEKAAFARMLKLIWLCYAKAFLTAVLPAAAPHLHLEFWPDMTKYKVCYQYT